MLGSFLSLLARCMGTGRTGMWADEHGGPSHCGWHLWRGWLHFALRHCNTRRRAAPGDGHEGGGVGGVMALKGGVHGEKAKLTLETGQYTAQSS